MRDLLHELRSIIEHELEMHGDYLPLDDDPEPEASAAADSASQADGPTGAPAVAAPAPSNPADSNPADPNPAESEPADSEPADSASTEPASTESAADPADSAPSPPTDTPSSSDSTSSMPNYDLFGDEIDPTEDPTRPPAERLTALIPDDAPYKDAGTLEEVEDFLANNILIPLDEQRKNPVFGVGDPEADLVIIGEAPGRNEDEQGEPFVGRAGKLLDKILDAIDFSREDVYITNILKSRPPRNRDPKAEEIEAHIPVLYKQLALIQPKILLCVGKVAGNTMLDRRSSLSSLRNKEHDFYGIPVIVTYHPAALLRNSQWKRPTWEDVKLLRTRYDELTDAG